MIACEIILRYNTTGPKLKSFIYHNWWLQVEEASQRHVLGQVKPIFDTRNSSSGLRSRKPVVQKSWTLSKRGIPCHPFVEKGKSLSFCIKKINDNFIGKQDFSVEMICCLLSSLSTSNEIGGVGMNVYMCICRLIVFIDLSERLKQWFTFVSALLSFYMCWKLPQVFCQNTWRYPCTGVCHIVSILIATARRPARQSKDQAKTHPQVNG